MVFFCFVLFCLFFLGGEASALYGTTNLLEAESGKREAGSGKREAGNEGSGK